MSHDNTRVRTIGQSTITVGRFTYGDERIDVKQWDEGASLNIGAFCSIADNVKIFLGGNHRTDWISTYPFGLIHTSELGSPNPPAHPVTKGAVVIGNDVWISQGVTIMSGVSIGDGAVVAANSTVVKNVPPYSVVGGNPAEVIKFRFDDEIISLLLEFKWWELSTDNIKNLLAELCQPPDASKLRDLIRIYR